ncbi:hypothetical protein F53441_1226 [Fusarium austroafricanum]|uniref:Mid2 domain-containing protein n=1 Tax=Fusarium austroafricanum TaxID=2364996 RepID=A0A8H4KSI9_9HYPO|nr:hypothetical protein F53441_1226 [Fusarium austroafricanum]
MHRSSILLGAMLHAANALDRAHAAPRDRVRAAAPEITAPPFGVIDEFDLLKGHHGLRPRQAQASSNLNLAVTIAPDKTCGYMSGAVGVPITCGNGSPCSWAATSGVGLVACGTEIYVNCVESSQAVDPKACNDVCQSNTYNLLCTNSDEPYCRTYAFPNGIKDYRCESTSVKSIQSVEFTYDGQKNAKFSTTTLSDGIESNKPEPTISIKKDDKSDSSASSDGAPASTSTDPSDSSEETHHSSKSSTPIGAIVGGVVGGVALIGIIGLVAVCLLRRRKPKPAPAAPVQPPMAQNPPPPPPMAMQQPYPTHQPHPYPDPSMATSPAPSDARVSMLSGSNSAVGPASPMGWNQIPSPSPFPTPAPAYEMASNEVKEQEPVYEMGGDSSMKK